MKRQLLTLLALGAVLLCAPLKSADADRPIRSRGISHGHGIGRGLGFGFADGGYSDIFGYAELYRELYNNLPYFALHPPVYYSVPVPRTYGYSPFAYPGDIMTPELAAPVQPVTILNPHVNQKAEKPAEAAKDRAASVEMQVKPLVVVNPFVASGRAMAQAGR
jgi:hypothetical protein